MTCPKKSLIEKRVCKDIRSFFDVTNVKEGLNGEILLNFRIIYTRGGQFFRLRVERVFCPCGSQFQTKNILKTHF